MKKWAFEEAKKMGTKMCIESVKKLSTHPPDWKRYTIEFKLTVLFSVAEGLMVVLRATDHSAFLAAISELKDFYFRMLGAT